MLLVTTERIAGREIEPLGIVEGSSVQTVHAGKDIMLATDKMVRNAEQMGADAVVCVRYSSSEVMQGAAEVLVYGTAVRLI